MKVLFIGGTGIISSGCVQLALDRGMDVTLLNRGKSFRATPKSARVIEADIRDFDATKMALGNNTYDVVAEFTGFVPAHIDTDLKLFSGQVGQYLYISSASAYQTPPQKVPVTEETPLENPVWEYSRNKIACEARLMQAYRETGFPVTIVRPSHTYDETLLPFRWWLDSRRPHAQGQTGNRSRRWYLPLDDDLQCRLCQRFCGFIRQEGSHR